MGKVDTVWERTDPVSQLKEAIIGNLVKITSGMVGGEKIVTFTIHGMCGERYCWDAAVCRVVRTDEEGESE
jgi:hypothetical protein